MLFLLFCCRKRSKAKKLKWNTVFSHKHRKKGKIHTKSLQGERRMNEIELKLDKLQMRKKEKLHCTKSFYEVLLRSHEASFRPFTGSRFRNHGNAHQSASILAAATYQEHYKTRDGEPHVHPR